MKKLARKRAERLLGVAGSVDKRKARDADGVAHAATEVADAFAAHGYAAETNHVGSGLQLCQHHCPVSHVAHEFPQLCEAETEVISKVLGRHVQRLATIAHGDGVCTTSIPRSTTPSTTRTTTRTAAPTDERQS